MSKKYDEMKAFYENRLEELREERNRWRDKYMNQVYKTSAAKTKNQIYDELLPKLLGDRSKDTDEFFMLDGRIYRLVSYSLDHEDIRADRLTVEFVATTYTLTGKEEKV